MPLHDVDVTNGSRAMTQHMRANGTYVRGGHYLSTVYVNQFTGERVGPDVEKNSKRGKS